MLSGFRIGFYFYRKEVTGLKAIKEWKAGARQNELMRHLCRVRHDTLENLAAYFGVNERTIRRDLEELSECFPYELRRGRHGGGVYVYERYRMDALCMKREETALLRSVLSAIDKGEPVTLHPEERRLFENIIKNYGFC